MGRGAHFTREFQQMARAHVKRDSLVRAGRAGYEACRAKYGPNFASQRIAAWREANPSPLEETVAAWLDDLGVQYQREWQPTKHSRIFFDFRLTDFWAVVEVDGDGWHSGRAPEADARAERDEQKERFCRYHKMRLLRLHERAVRDGSARAVLEEFVR